MQFSQTTAGHADFPKLRIIVNIIACFVGGAGLA
jgi:hypothetical protein